MINNGQGNTLLSRAPFIERKEYFCIKTKGMKSCYLHILLFSIILVSCERSLDLRLDKADEFLSSRPDSSLALLMSIDSEELSSQMACARYALLMSAALDKNYIDIQSDSLIRIAVNYYGDKGSSREKMLSLYYHGIVLKNAQEYIQSILSFEKAEKEADILKDYLFLGLIFRNKASIYSMTNNNPGAIECREKAIECFDIAGAGLYKEYALLALAADYSNQYEFEKADSLLEFLLSTSRDPGLLSQCSIRKASILVMQDQDPETVIDLYRNCPREMFGILDYSYLAQAYEMLHQRDSSDYWFSEGYLHCTDQLDSASLDYMRSWVEKKRGHYETAFRLVDHATTVQDSLTRVLLQQSVSSAQRDYYKDEAVRQEERIRQLRARTVRTGMILLLVLALLIISFQSRSREKDRQLQEQMARLALEERELERVNKDNAHLVGALFSEKIDHFDKMSESYFRMEDSKQKEALFKQIKQLAATIRNDEELFRSLEKDLDRYCNGIVSKLRVQVPRIKGDNYRIITLFFAGFSYETVQFILNKVSVESLKTARSRFRKDIKNAGAPDTELFLKMLEMKKRPQAGTNENMGIC